MSHQVGAPGGLTAVVIAVDTAYIHEGSGKSGTVQKMASRMIERGDFFPRLLTFRGSLGRSMKRRILHGAQRILASGDPKAPQAQLR